MRAENACSVGERAVLPVFVERNEAATRLRLAIAEDKDAKLPIRVAVPSHSINALESVHQSANRTTRMRFGVEGESSFSCSSTSSSLFSATGSRGMSKRRARSGASDCTTTCRNVGLYTGVSSRIPIRHITLASIYDRIPVSSSIDLGCCSALCWRSLRREIMASSKVPPTARILMDIGFV